LILLDYAQFRSDKELGSKYWRSTGMYQLMWLYTCTGIYDRWLHSTIILILLFYPWFKLLKK
jgi:hypothetical protein